jgi:hypothetical protein
MKVNLYTISWNEADMLGFFFRHYDPWVDRYVVYDNGSTDGTLDLLHAHPRVEVRKFEWTDPESFVNSHQAMHNHSWEESREIADWVVITAIDEHLHVPGMANREYLEHCRKQKVTLLYAMGFQMVSEEFPEPEETLCETRTVGAPYARMSKLSIFDPKAIRKTNFKGGRHVAYPEGRIKLPRRDRLLLLHYKNIGFERVYKRHRELKNGLGPRDAKQRWAKKYDWSKEKLRQDWDLFADSAVDLASGNNAGERCHYFRRWWRRSWRLLNLLKLISSDVLSLPRLPNERWAD